MVLFATIIRHGVPAGCRDWGESELTVARLITVSFTNLSVSLVLEGVPFSPLPPLRLENGVKIRRKGSLVGRSKLPSVWVTSISFSDVIL